MAGCVECAGNNWIEKKREKEDSSGDDGSLAEVPFHNGVRSETSLARATSLAQVYSLVRLRQSGHHAGNSHH
jgi:hypothetical protein